MQRLAVAQSVLHLIVKRPCALMSNTLCFGEVHFASLRRQLVEISKGKILWSFQKGVSFHFPAGAIFGFCLRCRLLPCLSHCFMMERVLVFCFITLDPQAFAFPFHNREQKRLKDYNDNSNRVQIVFREHDKKEKQCHGSGSVFEVGPLAAVLSCKDHM